QPLKEPGFETLLESSHLVRRIVRRRFSNASTCTPVATFTLRPPNKTVEVLPCVRPWVATSMRCSLNVNNAGSMAAAAVTVSHKYDSNLVTSDHSFMASMEARHVSD